MQSSIVKTFASVATILSLVSGMAHSQTPNFRFDRYWPALNQPWYFSAGSTVSDMALVKSDKSVFVTSNRPRSILHFSDSGQFIAAVPILTQFRGNEMPLSVDSGGVLFFYDCRPQPFPTTCNAGVYRYDSRTGQSSEHVVYEEDVRIVALAHFSDDRLAVYSAVTTFPPGGGSEVAPRLEVFSPEGALLRRRDDLGAPVGTVSLSTSPDNEVWVLQEESCVCVCM